MIDTDAAWGIPFDPEDLDAALVYCSDAGLPNQIAHAHEGCCEVIEIDGRYAGYQTPAGFSIYRDIERPNEYAVTEGEVDGVERRRYFTDLIAALKFCKAQRGEDWPSD